MDENRLDALAASLARTDGRRRSTLRILGRWLRGSPLPAADGHETAVPTPPSAGPVLDLNRRRLLIRGAAAAGAAVWIPPVIQSITMPAAAQAGTGQPGCTANEGNCSSDTECCSGHCNDGVCGPCVSPGSCTEDTECCNGHCVGYDPSGAEPVFGTCCNLTGQGPVDSHCSTDADCCNNILCHSSGVCCARNDEEFRGFCETDADCCPEVPSCHGSSHTGAGDGTCCNDAGGSCATAFDCCDQHSCETGACCIPLDGACTSDNDLCCEGFTCDAAEQGSCRADAG